MRKFSKFSIINTFDKKENKTKKNIVNWFNFKTAAYVTMFSVLCVAIVLTVHFVLPQGRTLTASVETNCGIEEHKHSPDCYDADGNVVCGKIEHYHTSDCFAQNVADYVDYKCGFDYAHEHSDDCYKNGVLTCSLTEHHHTVRCLFDGSNYGDACDEYITACTRLVKTLDYTSNEEYINLIKSDVDDVAAFINEAYDSNAIYTSEYNDLKAQVTALTNDFNAQVAEQIEASKAPETADNDNEDLPVEVVPVKKEADSTDPLASYTGRSGTGADNTVQAITIKSGRTDGYTPTTTGKITGVDKDYTYHNYELKVWYYNGHFYTDAGHSSLAKYVDYVYEFSDTNPIPANISGSYPGSVNNTYYTNQANNGNYGYFLSYSVNCGVQGASVSSLSNYVEDCTTIEAFINRIQAFNRRFFDWSNLNQSDATWGTSCPFGKQPARIARVVIILESPYTVNSSEKWGYYNTSSYGQDINLTTSSGKNIGYFNTPDVLVQRGAARDTSEGHSGAMIYIKGSSNGTNGGKGDAGNISFKSLVIGSEVVIDSNDSNDNDCCVCVDDFGQFRLNGGQLINSQSYHGMGAFCTKTNATWQVWGGSLDLFGEAIVKGFKYGAYAQRSTVRFYWQHSETKTQSYTSRTGSASVTYNCDNYGTYSVNSGTRNRTTNYTAEKSNLSDNTIGIYLYGSGVDKLDSYIMKMCEESLSDIQKVKVELSSNGWTSNNVIFSSGYKSGGAYNQATPCLGVVWDGDDNNAPSDLSNAHVKNAWEKLKVKVVGERGKSAGTATPEGTSNCDRCRFTLNEITGGFELTALQGNFDTEFAGGSVNDYNNALNYGDDRYPCLRIANTDEKVCIVDSNGVLQSWYRNLTEAVGFNVTFASGSDNVGTRKTNITSGCQVIVFADTEEDSVMTATTSPQHSMSGGILLLHGCTIRNGDSADTSYRQFVTTSGSTVDHAGHNYTVRWTENTPMNADFHGINMDYCINIDNAHTVTLGGATEGSLTFDAGSTNLKKMTIKGVEFAITNDFLDHQDRPDQPLLPFEIQNPLICVRPGATLNIGSSASDKDSAVILTKGSVPAEAVQYGSTTKIVHDGRAAGVFMYDSAKVIMNANSKITNCVGFWGGAIYTAGSGATVTIKPNTEISYVTSMRSPIHIVNGATINISGGWFHNNYARTGLVAEEFCKYNPNFKDGDPWNYSDLWEDHLNESKPFHVYDGPNKAKTGGSGRGGCLFVGGNGSTATLTGGLFEFNGADVYGGAIYSSESGDGDSGLGKLTMSNVELRYNFALRGGAVQVDGGQRPNGFVTTFTNCYFHDNIAYEIDYKQETYSDDGTPANMRHYIGNSIDNIRDADTNSGRGGAIRVAEENTELLLKDCVITDNIAELRGGGICQSYNCKITLEDTIVAENYAKKVTAAGDRANPLYVTEIAEGREDGTYSIEITSTNNNGKIHSSNVGGGICIDDKSTAANHAILTIKGNTNGTSVIGETTITSGFGARTAPYTGNYAYDGGGIHAVSYGQIDFNTGDIYKNVATHDGGGVYAFEHVLINVYSGKATYNEAGRDGGGYSLHNYATLNLYGDSNDATKRAIVDYNRALQDGGGINCRDASFVNIDNGQINNNIAGRYGGGINAVGWDSTHTLVEFTKGTINNNATRTGAVSDGAITGCGGGIYATNYDTTNSTKSSYIVMNPTANANTTDANGAHINNNASANGAGVYLDYDAKMDITGGDISNNVATQDGGGMFINRRATANLTSTVRISVMKNKAVNGAGINVVTDAATSSSAIADCTLNGTSANLVIQDNAASNNGGGIRIASGGYVEAKGTTNTIYIGNNSDHKNTAGNDGGGVYITGRYTGNSQNILSTFNMKAGQIMHNTATGDGGGVCIKDYGVMYLSDIDNTTAAKHIKIHSNTATDGTGIYQDGTLYLNGGPLFYISGQNNQHTSANDIYLAAQVVTTDTAGLTDVIESGTTTPTVHVITKNGTISDNIKDVLTDWPNNAERTSTGGTVSIPVTLGQMAGAQGGNNFDGRDYVVSLGGKNQTNADTTTVIPDDLTKFWVKNPTVYDCIYNDSANSAHQDRIGNHDINTVAVLELDVKQTYSIDVQKQVGLDKNMYPSFDATTVAYDTNSGVTKAFNYTATITNGTFDAVTFGGTHEETPVKTNSTTITFSLKSGENLLINNLAPRSSVTITETTDSNYTAYSKVDAPFTDNETLPAASNVQTISNISDSHSVYFKNIPVNRFFLVWKKAGSGNTQNTGTFSFKFRITDKAGNRITTTLGNYSEYNTTSGVTFTEDQTDPGTMIFTLGFNQRILFNIPYGMTPYVEEVPAPGFTTYVKVSENGLGESSNVNNLHYNNEYTFNAVSSSSKSAYFYNTANNPLPHTIGVNINIFTAAGMSIMLLAVAAAFVVRAYARKH